MEKIYRDNFTKLSIDNDEKWSFQSETENSKNYKENLIKKGVYAASEVQKEKNLIKSKNINDPKEIPVQVRFS